MNQDTPLTLDPFFLVRQWRAAMGLKNGNITVYDERMMLHRRLFLEEMNELLHAIDTNDTKEIQDGFADLIFVITGMMLELGHNPHEVFYKVYESNMSKVCYSEEEAMETVELYAAGLHPDKMGEKINTRYRSIEDGHFFVIERVSDGKVMKSMNYKPPRW